MSHASKHHKFSKYPYLQLLKYWMYLIFQLEYNYRSTTKILESSVIISDFTDSIISINCCFKSISKSPSCSSDNHRTRNTSQTDHQIIIEQRSGCKDQTFISIWEESLYFASHMTQNSQRMFSFSFLVSFSVCLSWLGHRDLKNAKGPEAWYTPLLWQKAEVNHA